MTTKVSERMQAYFGDRGQTILIPFGLEEWKLQGISPKDASARPLANAINYASSGTYRVIFDNRVKIPEGKRFREVDGIWLKQRPGKESESAGPPAPYVPGSAGAKLAEERLPLYITDREDITAVLVACEKAAMALPTGAPFFQNDAAVDRCLPDQPRPLHPACKGIAFGDRPLCFLMEDRDLAMRTARGLRQGGAHTGKVFYSESSSALVRLDALISQNLPREELLERTLPTLEADLKDATSAVDVGDPLSVGARLPPELLEPLPHDVRNLQWPYPEGAGSSWENLDWTLAKTGAILGTFRDQRGEETILTKHAVALHTPVYITRRLVSDNTAYLELLWVDMLENGAKKLTTKILEAGKVLHASGQTLMNAGVPVADAKRAAQWFNAMLIANPNLPRVQLHLGAGWVHSKDGYTFLLPDVHVEGHEVSPDILQGLKPQGSAESHWECFSDFYKACAPVNQLMLNMAHASLLNAALKLQGCVFGLVDQSSKGKTVFLETCGRQYGWDGGDYNIDASIGPTMAYVERVVQRTNGLCVFIDEFHKLPNTHKEAGAKGITRQEAAYFLSNGRRRGRSNAAGGIDATGEQIFCYAIVAGEAKHITATEKASQMEGARVRMINVPLVGVSDDFLAKYGTLGRFVSRMRESKGHIGREAARALADELTEAGIHGLRQRHGEIVEKMLKAFHPEGTEGVAVRRMQMLASGLLVETILGKRLGYRDLWSAELEKTAGWLALSGPYAAHLTGIEADANEEHDDIPVMTMLLEALHQDPTLIQGLRDDTWKANQHPLGKLVTRPDANPPGIRLYPQAVYRYLRQQGVPEHAARVLLRKSPDILKKRLGKTEEIHWSANGLRFLLPAPAWGWELYLAAPGDEDALSRDILAPYRKDFETLFDAKVKSGVVLQTAFDLAIERFRAEHAWALKPGKHKYLPAAIAEGNGRVWCALTKPLLERLEGKDGSPTVQVPWVEEGEAVH